MLSHQIVLGVSNGIHHAMRALLFQGTYDQRWYQSRHNMVQPLHVVLIIEKMKTVMGVIHFFLVEQQKQQIDSGVYTMEEAAEPKAVAAELRADIYWLSLRFLGGYGRHRFELVGGLCKVVVVRAMSAKEIRLV
jgi:hypothetical protein